jgi:uncharacterized protein with gpF-like domain
MAAPRAALPHLSTRRAFERAALTRLVLSHENALQAHLAQALAVIGRHSAKAYRQGDAVTKVADIRHTLARVLRPSLVNTARAFADRVTHHPKCSHAFETKAAFESLDGAIRDFMDEHTAEAVVGISDTTRTTIANAIRRGEADNLSVEQIARAIVEATSGEIGLARARRIARTETHAAAMYGQQAAAEESPLAFHKVWLATEDHRTRKDHADANGQVRPLDEPFNVGDAELMYPGDTSAPPEQIINCRCVALYEPAAIGDDDK